MGAQQFVHILRGSCADVEPVCWDGAATWALLATHLGIFSDLVRT